MSQPTLQAIKKLFAVSGNRCAFQECSTPLVDPASGKVTGRICHIKAQSVGGPRYDADQSEAERHGFENLLLMCPVHHDVIDADAENYSVERLQKMKLDHEFSVTSHPTTMAALSDKLASQFLQTLRVVNLVDGSQITSVNQSGGQTAHSITNIERQVILTKQYSEESVVLSTFTINQSKCAYVEYRLDPTRPLWPEDADPLTVCFMPGGRVRLYGKEFSSRAEAERYGDKLRGKYNHHTFYAGAPHSIFLDRLPNSLAGNAPNYPVFYVSLSNHTNSHVVLSALVAVVHHVQPLTAIGESHTLLPLITYELAFQAREGAYRNSAIPALKIESGDAAAFSVVLKPHVSRMGGYHWFMSLRFHLDGYSVESPMFTIVM
jgi:hypothetical protein